MRVLVAVVALFACGAVAGEHPADWRLIRVSDDIEFWASPEQIASLAVDDVGFADVTDTYDLEKFAQARALPEQSYPTQPLQETLVRALISEFSIANFNSTLTTFSGFRTRHCQTPEGVESATWLEKQVQQAIAGVGTVTTFDNPQFGQFNVIARLEGDGSSNDLVIIGAHQDSISGFLSRNDAPGADDDGSGSMMILEALRVVAANIRSGRLVLKRPVEFQWFAGEEIGLVGSRNLANDYRRRDVPVYSMMQFDMIGYGPPGVGVGVVTDYTSSVLNAFTRVLINAYLTIGYRDNPCGYGCSDHASYTSAGYPASFPFEAPYGQQNPNIHTIRDTIANGVDMDRAEQFGFLGLSYIVEASLAP